ncbi:hypothetical protein [Kitasatospora paranensis]|uniref:Uncharacterized protein n=1 Tax=Kitasatospora paranensis TaxID=258053 RepID=A0ABW2FX90_9ACTN
MVVSASSACECSVTFIFTGSRGSSRTSPPPSTQRWRTSAPTGSPRKAVS